MGNPKAAVAAITSDGERVGNIVLHEMSLGRLALLERINSPFAGGGGLDTNKINVSLMLPVVYILSTPTAEVIRALRDGTFEEAVAAFGESIPMKDMLAVLEAVGRILKRMADVMPSGAVEADGEGKK